jgi:hypothetical protein
VSLTSRLSSAALRYVEAFESVDAAFMAERFYAYHTFPATRAWRARLASRKETAAYLGIARRPILRVEWIGPDAKSESWFSWRRRGESAATIRPRFKLYMSPHCGDLPEVFGSATDVLTEANAVAFKVGSGLRGLLRPDKMVGYFADFTTLSRAAAALEKRIAGARVHGVPFSCQLDSVGLLSWGVDPEEAAIKGDGVPSSWRRRVAARLAALFVEARNVSGTNVSNYALERLGAEGVDVRSWTVVEPLR